MHTRTPRRPRRIRVLAAGLVVTAAFPLLAACSPKRSTTTTASPSPAAKALTKEDYIKQAAVLCASSLPSVQPSQTPTAAGFLAGVRAEIDSLKDLQARLRSLEPPAADRKDLEQNFLTPRDQQIAALEKALPFIEKEAKAGNLQGAVTALTPAAQEAVNLAAETENWLTSYGLRTCAL